MATQDADAKTELLPTYLDAAGTTTAPPVVTHALQMKDKHEHAWLTLQVRSKARSPESAPRFVEGDPIAGNVVLDLKENTDVKAIIVQVRRRI